MKTMKFHSARPPSAVAGGRRALLWLRGLLMLLLIGAPGLAQAAQVHIKATYLNGQLQIQSQSAPYCTTWPELCRSVHTLPLPFTYTKHFDPNGAQTDRLFLKVPRSWAGTLTSDAGNTYPFDFKFQAFGLMVRSAYSKYNPVSFPFYGNCSVLRRRLPPVDGDWGAIALQFNGSGWPCYSDRSAFNSYYNVYVKEMGAAYLLGLPSLSSMKPGRYSGMLSLRVGEGGDLDLGRRLKDLNDTVLDISIELTVSRDISVEFPPGSERAILEPVGGWQIWSGGKPPKQLVRDLPFRISIDGPFGVYLKCQYTTAVDRCGLRNPRGDEVPVSTRLTLRSATSGGSSAVKVPLPTSEHDKRVLTPLQPLLNQPGTLHFSVESEEIKRMLENPGSTYQGQVTVVFDAWI
ncbi:hypothetical protein ACNFG0_17995 [Pseudomonas sp. NY15372]|uniref:hypothetical protein n=1 Tax=Pseudomonas sp. NY15372 TaxID=3400356 RepID=UPI003A844F38